MSEINLSLVQLIQNGELVDAGVTNRPTSSNDRNIRLLAQILEDLLQNEALIDHQATVVSTAEVGQPVYYEPTTGRYELAQAQVENDSLGRLVGARKSQVRGIVLRKNNSTNADIALAGKVEVDLSAAISGTPVPGDIYYLSAGQAGALTSVLPPLEVSVLLVGNETTTSGTYEVYLVPKLIGFAVNQQAYAFDLVSLPAGDHTPPAVNGTHTITNADNTQEGWLPASDSIFGGLAPANAKFGYNISASAFAELWPPIPSGNAVMELRHGSPFFEARVIHETAVLDFPNIAANGSEDLTVAVAGARTSDPVIVTVPSGPAEDGVIQAWVSSDNIVTIRYSNPTGGALDPSSQTYDITVFKTRDPDLDAVDVFLQGYQAVAPEYVQIDEYGIWWMSDCYNGVPWDADYDSSAAASSLSVGCPIDTAGTSARLFFTRPNYINEETAVTRLRGTKGITFYCRNTDTIAETGSLDAEVDLGLLLNETAVAGSTVLKGINEDNEFTQGAVVEGIKSASPELVVSSSLGATPSGPSSSYQGVLTLTANLSVDGTRVPVDTVRLNGVEQENYEDTIGLLFPSSRTANFRGRLRVPDAVTLPSGTQLKLRFFVLGRAAGSLDNPTFTITRRILEQPATVNTANVTLATSETATTISTAGVTYANADEYVMLETEAFDVSAGDVVLFTMERGSDSYAADLIILLSEGVLVAGS